MHSSESKGSTADVAAALSSPAGSAAASSHPPRRSLHRDVLHCVFAFLGRAREYAVAATVCSVWRDAAYSSPVGHAHLTCSWSSSVARLSTAARRSWVRSVTLAEACGFTDHADERRRFAECMPHITDLTCCVNVWPPADDSTSSSSSSFPLTLPPRLTRLHLSLVGRPVDPLGDEESQALVAFERFAAVMESVSLLGASLEVLEVEADLATLLACQRYSSDAVAADTAAFTRVASIARMTKLHTLVRRQPESDSRSSEGLYYDDSTDFYAGLARRLRAWPTAAIGVLRDMPNLTHVDCFDDAIVNWQLLLSEPRTLRLLSLPPLPASAADHHVHPADLFSLVRGTHTLTRLDSAFLVPKERNPAVISHLPALRDLRWTEVSQPAVEQISWAPLDMELRTCTQLRQLHIASARISDRQLSVVVACLPHLSSLSLDAMVRLRSLRFLRAVPHLRELHLSAIHLPRGEFLSNECPARDLYQLHTLRVSSSVPRSDASRVAQQMRERRAARGHVDEHAISYDEKDLTLLPQYMGLLDPEEEEEDAAACALAMSTWQGARDDAVRREAAQFAATSECTVSLEALHRRCTLHSVLAFLGGEPTNKRRLGGIRECALFAQVSRTWRDAAYTAPTGHAHLHVTSEWLSIRRGEAMDPTLSSLPGARLGRCLRSVRLHQLLSQRPDYEDRLRRALAVAAPPHIRSLECRVHIGARSPLMRTAEWGQSHLLLPPGLERLTLHIDHTSSDVSSDGQRPEEEWHTLESRITRILDSVADAAASTLCELHLRPQTVTDAEQMSFEWVAPIARLQRLRKLTLVSGGNWYAPWPSHAIDAVCSLRSLTHFDCFGARPATNLTSLMDHPNVPPLRSVISPRAIFTENVASLLTRLPSLTSLWPLEAVRVDTAFLSSLPNLRRLRLAFEGVALLRNEVVLASCTQLRMLHLLKTRLTDADLCTITPHLMHLEDLLLHSHGGRVRTLAFLARDTAPHLALTLERLTLACHLTSDQCIGATSPIAHLAALRSLTLDKCVQTSEIAHVMQWMHTHRQAVAVHVLR